MAKVKKEKLSLEEMLELALVKEADRPYEVPGNWVWTRLENISEFNQGIQISVENQYKEFIDGRIRFIRIVDYTQGTDDIRYITLPSQKGDGIMVQIKESNIIKRQ